MITLTLEDRDLGRRRYFKSYEELEQYFENILGFELDWSKEEIMSGKVHSSNFYSIKYVEILIPKNHKAWNPNLDLREVFDEKYYEGLRNQISYYYDYMMYIEENVESFRIGLIEDKESMAEYEEIKTSGASDDRIISIGGVDFMFGCNFGH